MIRLPVLGGSALVRRLEKLGYEVDHQSGSHIILRHRDPPHKRLSVPNHRSLAKGTLRAILRHAGLRVEDIAR